MTDEMKASEILGVFRRGDIAQAKELLESNPNLAKVKVSGCMGSTLLHYAVSDGYTPMVELLLDCGADPNAKDDRDFTPLHRAADGGRMHTAELLLRKGASIDVRDDNGMTPLHLASFEGHTDTVRLLLDQPFADVNAKDFRRRTPLHSAAANCQVSTAELLLGHGADVNAVADDGGTPLDWAWFRQNNKPIVELLHKHGGMLKATKG